MEGRAIDSVSVVIPVKDDAENLAKALGAILPQLGEADEIIVVDNGSTDDSAEVARRLGARVVQQHGGGIPAASATGYDAASGDIIARLDADCLPADSWIAAIRERFSSRQELTAITGPATFIDGPRWLRRSIALVYLGSYYASLAPALGHVPLFGSNCAFRRAAWLEISDAVHRDDEMVHDDLDLAFHLGPLRRIRYCRELEMGISMRPLFDGRAFRLRLRRGFHSVVLHWPHELPWLRWGRTWVGRSRNIRAHR